MTPAGYMAKKVAERPEWIQAPAVADLYSLSGCVSDYFTDYIPHWKHNGYWLFDSAEIIKVLARDHAISLEGCKFFYYEVFEQEYDDHQERWQRFGPDGAFRTSVTLPATKRLEGYDVVTFSAHTSPECSPLSCNNLAATLPANRHCLLPTFEEAKSRIESGSFRNSEPGPFRIFAVHTIDGT